MSQRISLATEYLGAALWWKEEPPMFREPSRPIPDTQEALMSARGYISALKLLLHSSKHGDGAPWEKKSTSGRDASSHGGKSMTVTARDKRDSREPLGKAGCRHEGRTDTLRTKEILQISQQSRKLLC